VAQNKPIPLPSGALEVQSTLSWAGDFGKMVARLLFNDKAYCQAFTVGTAEHHSWKEIVEIYNRIIGLKYIPVETEEFIELIGGTVAHRQQLLYDRYFNRAIDNTKILTATGFRQTDLMPTEKGLRMELAKLDLNDIPFNPDWDTKADKLLKL
jgi:nucleoside-diphosphate-sugar epimerase